MKHSQRRNKMFAGKTIWEIIHLGGFMMYILLFCSVLSITILLERIIYYRKRSRIKRSLNGGNVEMAKEICRTSNAPFSRVVFSGLGLHGRLETEISNAMDRE